MANKATRDLRALDTHTLEQRLDETKADITGARFGLATRQTENTARLGQSRRQLARILTILAERRQEE